MICQAQFNFRQTTHIAQLRQARSARSTSRTHAACRGGYPGVHAPHSELFFDVISALTAACVLALWAEVAEPQKEPDVRQPEAIMVHTPQLISRSLSEYGVLIEDDMDDGGGELVVPQSPNPGVPDAPGAAPARPSTPTEPPSNPPSKTAPFPAEPVPPIAGDPPHFLLNWSTL